MTNNNMKAQENNSGSGKYTANGFVPNKQANKQDSGCLSMVIMFLAGAGAVVSGIIYLV